jgi:hypothetical protein
MRIAKDPIDPVGTQRGCADRRHQDPGERLEAMQVVHPGAGAGSRTNDQQTLAFVYRRPKRSRHNCDGKSVTLPSTTMAGRRKPFNGAGFQGLRSKAVTSQPVPPPRSKVVSTFLII